MAEELNLDAARQAIEGGMGRAQEVLNDPSQMDELLAEIQNKAKDLPATVGGAMLNIPQMVSLIKSYITREYTEVSPKVVVSVVSAMLYLVKGKDIIPDAIPIVGLLDDVAVITVAMLLTKNGRRQANRQFQARMLRAMHSTCCPCPNSKEALWPTRLPPTNRKGS